MLLNQVNYANHKMFNKDEVDGFVSIVDGKVYVKDENIGGMPPSIVPCSGTTLSVNSNEFHHAIYVSELDKIEITEEEFLEDAKVEIEFEDLDTKAYINYYPKMKYKYKLLDKPFINRIEIEVEKILLEEIKITKEELIEILKNNGVKYGIIEETLEKIESSNLPGRYLVAEGTECVPPIDDSIDIYFQDEYEKEFYLHEDERGYVDYKNCYDYKDVQVGQVLGIIHKGKKGKSGITVKGESQKSFLPRRIKIIQGDYVHFNKYTGVITAKKAGKPRKFINGESIIFKIIEKITLDEVNMKTGNIRYKGNIEIINSISEDMEVFGHHDVLIKGNVYSGRVFATNNIDIKGLLISGNVSSGIKKVKRKSPMIEISKILKEIDSLLENIKCMSDKEKEKLGINKYEDVIAYLLNGANKNLSVNIYKSICLLRKEEYDLDEKMLIYLINLSKGFMGKYKLLVDIENTLKIRNQIEEIFTKEKNYDVTGNIKLNYLLNSKVTSIGEVLIKGKGAFNSTIRSAKKVSILGELRGGEVVAEEIIANKVGSKNGVKTVLKVPENGRIKINTVYPDTILKIGKHTVKFYNEQRGIFARISHGKIIY
jgi:uncharacterized protein (DUF342 family)